jgi:hypothetical protein
MAGLLYYLSGRSGQPNLADLRGWGLGYAFEVDPEVGQCVRGGPDAGGGLVLADPRQRNRVGIYLNDQKWLRMPAPLLPEGAPTTWVGYETARPPGPAELAMARQIPGHLVRLRDGNDWLCPVARGSVDVGDALRWCKALPSCTGVDEETGQWVRGDVVPEHSELWSLAQRWWDVWIAAGVSSAELREAGDPEPKVDVDFDIRNVAEAALATNYRVSRVEVALLALFDETVERDIANALVDWPTWAAWHKKKAAAG